MWLDFFFFFFARKEFGILWAFGRREVEVDRNGLRSRTRKEDCEL